MNKRRYFVLMLLFVCYLLASNTLFIKYVKLENEAISHQKVDAFKGNDLKFHIDQLSVQQKKWKEVLFIKGWAFKGEAPLRDRNLFLLFSTPTDTLTFLVPKQDIPRIDLTNKLKLKGGNIWHGFETIIPINYLVEDKYKLGVIIKDKNGSSYKAMAGEIFVKPGSVEKTQSDGKNRKMESENGISKNRSIKYHIDKLAESVSHIEISGWAFVEEVDPINQSIKLILESSDDKVKYSTQTVIRRDLTKHFVSSKFNLDKCGFRIKIPKKSLSKIEYSVKLEIEKDQNKYLTPSVDQIILK